MDGPTSYQVPKEKTLKLFMHEGYILNQNNINSKCVATLLNTDSWSEFAGGQYGYMAIGGPTVEMWCKAWNKVVEDTDGLKPIYANGNGTNGYYVGESENSISTEEYLTKGNTVFNTENEIIEKKYNVFFPHISSQNITASGKIGNCNGYWLASPSADITDYVMNINCDGRVRYRYICVWFTWLTTIGMFRRRNQIAKKYSKVRCHKNCVQYCAIKSMTWRAYFP